MEGREKTNLWRVTAQTLEWIYGLTNIEFDVVAARVAEVPQGEGAESHFAFEVCTNEVRLVGLRHPMALVVESYHIVLSGIISSRPVNIHFDESGVAEFESTEEMMTMKLQADKGGFSTVAVQVKMRRFDGGEDVLARHFLFRNNLLHMIR